MDIEKSQRESLEEVEASLVDHPFPPQLVVETTSRCNMKCLHCSHKEMKRERADMEGELFKKIAREVVREKPDCEIWPTFYGEALLLGEKLWRLLDYADEVGCTNMVLNSNGIMLAQPGVVEAVLDSPLRRFILSLDGYSKEVFEKIRVGGNRDKIYAAVERLIATKKERSQEFPVIQCQFSILDENEHELEPYREHWQSLGAEVKTRRKLTWTSTGSITASWMNPEPDFRIACPWGNNAAAILQNGDMVACAVDYEGRFVAGNVNRGSIKEIWAGSHKSKLRIPHREHRWEDIPEICRTCPDWQAVGAKYIGHEGKRNGARPFWHKERESEINNG